MCGRARPDGHEPTDTVGLFILQTCQGFDLKRRGQMLATAQAQGPGALAGGESSLPDSSAPPSAYA
eukprot:3315531-Rhodomonas_salina.2